MNLGNVIVTMGAVDAILLDNGKDRKIPFRARARLMRIRDVLRAEADIYEKERIKLINELGVEKEENGQKVISVPEDKTEEFYKSLEGVLTTEADVAFKRMTVEEFKDIEELDITVTDGQLKALFEFVFDKSIAADFGANIAEPVTASKEA